MKGEDETPMRITGLSSGLDIDKMVSDLMKAERMPLDKIKQQKTLVGWRTDQYREINIKLSSFRSTLNNLRLAGDWKVFNATSSADNIISAVAGTNASPISHTINVDHLASGAMVSSGGGLSNADLSATTAAGLSIDDTNNKFSITLGGVTKAITIDKKTYGTADDLRAQLQTQIDASFGANKVVVGENSGVLSFTPTGYSGPLGNNKPQIILQAATGNTGLSNLGFDLATNSQPSYKINKNLKLSDLVSSGKLSKPLTFSPATETKSFTINGQTITYGQDDTLSAVMDKVNQSAAGVTMSYDEVSDKVSITSNQTGKSSIIQLSESSPGILNSLQLLATAKITSGMDAEVTIDGVHSFRDSNTFSLDGVSYTVKDVGNATISVNRDTDATITKIKDFVTKYNEMVDLLNKAYKEERFKDFTPLTDDQKADMKDSDIKNWEEKAKSGLLRRDDILRGTLEDLRLYTSATVTSGSSKTNALYNIGIETLPYNVNAPRDSGKLQIDTDRLRKALESDPNSVVSLFSNQSTNEDEVGIANRMYNRINKSIDELITKAGSAGGSTIDRTKTLGLEMFNINKNILSFEAKLKQKENFYYARFSKMEQAIQNSNAQMSWLSQQTNSR